MQGPETHPGRVRRRLNDLVMAEMFLVQATIESATAIGDGINELGKQFSGEQPEEQSLGDLLQRTAEQALEPYSTRFKYLRDLLESEK